MVIQARRWRAIAAALRKHTFCGIFFVGVMSAAAAHAATLRGTISAKFPLVRIVAVERDRANVLTLSTAAGSPQAHVHAGKIGKNGAFRITGLRRGRTYDLIVWSKNARWEGVNMAYYRKILPSGPCRKSDEKQIKAIIEKVPGFFNKYRPLWIAADHHHAAVLVEMDKTNGFYSAGAGEVIFRVELWYFDNYFGGWAKVNNTEKTMTRWRGPADRLRKVWQYLPQLGGIRIPAHGPAAFHAKLPAAPVRQHGLVKGLQARGT